MAPTPKIRFEALAEPTRGTVVLLVGKDLAFGEIGRKLDERFDGRLTRAAQAAKFKGQPGKTLEILAPGGDIDRVVLLGIDWNDPERSLSAVGGQASGAAFARPGDITVVVDRENKVEREQAGEIALGVLLRTYSFDRYKTKKDEEDEEKDRAREVTIALADAEGAREELPRIEALAQGVWIARDLVNEPANVLGPEEFANEARKLSEHGVEVTVLDEPEMERLGMRALLAVGQGSARPSRLAVMEWKGGREGDRPICFVGKGVVFDTGGISIKPAGGMEDMKGDMGGAAAVVGAMHAIAKRKAEANVVGIIGLVENMPDGNAQRPGDIVTSMSGQTIEIINTDAEGRLVLADALWYAQETYKPELIIDLATLTGAIIVALGNEHAGLFCNDDGLAQALDAAGKATGDTVWRMPLGKPYDKLIDSTFADMKNTGGRWAGSVTAAQFLQRFVQDGTKWAHLDIAGTAFNATKNDVNRSWGSGFGVRLLDRLVRDRQGA